MNNELYFKRISVLLLNKWEVMRVSLYDEEGVEGWEWKSPHDYDIFTEVGDWKGWPALPECIYEEADRIIKEIG